MNITIKKVISFSEEPQDPQQGSEGAHTATYLLCS